MMTDPIADMLTRLRNAVAMRKEELRLPSSKLKIPLLQVLKNEGFIEDFEVVRERAAPPVLRIRLLYLGKRVPAFLGLRRVSKPGLRI